MKRRRLLSAVGAAATVAGAGCVEGLGTTAEDGGDSGSGGGDSGSGGNDSGSGGNDSGSSSGDTGSGDDDPDPDGEDGDDAGTDDTTDNPNDSSDTGDDRGTTDGATGDHHLYLTNLDGSSRRVALEVVRRSDDEQVLVGTYELPDRRGAEFRDVAAWGETYDIRAWIESGPSAAFEWEARSCAGMEAENGSRNGSVRVESDAEDLSFVVDQCDSISAGGEVATGPADRFRVADGIDLGAWRVEDPAKRHDFYLENLGDEPRRLEVRVVGDADGEAVVEGTYELPAETGATFEDVAGWDETYAVEATLGSGETTTDEWDLARCRGGEGANGSRNASVQVDPADAKGALRFVVDGCDAVGAGFRVPTGPASRFAVDDGN